MAVIILLFIGFFFIIAENNLNVSNTSSLGKFAELYFSWLGDVTYNSWQIAGYAVKLEWLPNQTAVKDSAVINSHPQIPENFPLIDF